MTVRQQYIDEALALHKCSATPEQMIGAFGRAVSEGATLAELHCLACAIPRGNLMPLVQFGRANRDKEPWASTLLALRDVVLAPMANDDAHKIREEGTTAFEQALKATSE